MTVIGALSPSRELDEMAVSKESQYQPSVAGRPGRSAFTASSRGGTAQTTRA